ncbi:hypothetical protein [Streptacidiphilus sp. EB129]
MSGSTVNGDEGDMRAAQDEIPDEGGTSDQVMHAQDESKAEGDRLESDD